MYRAGCKGSDRGAALFMNPGVSAWEDVISQANYHRTGGCLAQTAASAVVHAAELSSGSKPREWGMCGQLGIRVVWFWPQALPLRQRQGQRHPPIEPTPPQFTQHFKRTPPVSSYGLFLERLKLRQRQRSNPQSLRSLSPIFTSRPMHLPAPQYPLGWAP